MAGSFVLLLATASVIGPATSQTALAGSNDLNISFVDAVIRASAFDGGGASAVTDEASDDLFTTFLETVNAFDENVDSGRSATGDAFQDTEIVMGEPDPLGFDSVGTAEAGFIDPNPGDGSVPEASGLSQMGITFQVIGDPVTYSLTGNLSAAASSGDPPCTTATLTLFDDTTETASAPSGCGSPDSAEIDLTGQLQPGLRSLGIKLDTPAEGPVSSMDVSAEYDLTLRFCTIVAAGPNQTTMGTPGDDAICGTTGDDVIQGLGGNDKIYGLGGDDTLEGGDGADLIQGGDGDDPRIFGGAGNDTIDAGAGNDGTPSDGSANGVAGGPGDDAIDGGAGDDRIFGRCGETFHGTPSPVCPADPPVSGEDEDDDLAGGLGADRLFGDGGTNLITGGAGDDTAFAGESGDTLLLGEGSDKALGGGGNDDIDGGPGADLRGLLGFGGRDRIAGAADRDLIEGGAAADCIVGGTRKDTLRGDAGNDRFLAKDGTKDKVNGGRGRDRGRFDRQDAVSSVASRNLRGGC